MHHSTMFSLYDSDVVRVEQYGDKRRLILHRSLRKKGIEVEDKNKGLYKAENVGVLKLDNNISRARSKIFEYSYCNPWDYFVTLTINSKKYDRENLKKYHKDLTQFFRDYKKKYDSKIEFILVPELHSDGLSWHMHGLIKGILSEHLQKNEFGYMDWQHYKNKFGYISIDKIKSHEAVSRYITKYITKDMKNNVSELGGHTYYRSRGLLGKKEIKRGTLKKNVPDWEFENDFVKIKWLNENENIEDYIR